MPFIEPVTLAGRHARSSRSRATTNPGSGRLPRTASSGGSGTRASLRRRRRTPGSTRRSTCARVWAACRSQYARPRPAMSSDRRATSTSTPRTGASRSATRGTRSACSAPRSTPNASCFCSRTRSRRSRCIAVEFRTHFFNFASREAIARLGAKQDGILRNHQVMPDGTLRDTVVFSIIAPEWPTVKRHLAHRLER